MRYFEIHSPRPDFTGRVGAISFADGVARVSFDDARGESGECEADYPMVQTGRSAVLFAQRRPGYQVVETDASGQPLPEIEEKPKARRAPAKQTPKEPEQKQGENPEKKEGE
ncbi:hypothetical protein ACIBKY_26695 [Nonomuraea sp. NPDC050394]|uniref:hypothetical protein n=1 Tax=Nonomuraea sp. NPDC050394 TaxID=3364363 RepID=UPI0037AC160E